MKDGKKLKKELIDLLFKVYDDGLNRRDCNLTEKVNMMLDFHKSQMESDAKFDKWCKCNGWNFEKMKEVLYQQFIKSKTDKTE